MSYFIGGIVGLLAGFSIHAFLSAGPRAGLEREIVILKEKNKRIESELEWMDRREWARGKRKKGKR